MAWTRLVPPRASMGQLDPAVQQAIGNLNSTWIATPVAAGSAVLVAFGILWAALTGRAYPFRQAVAAATDDDDVLAPFDPAAGGMIPGERRVAGELSQPVVVGAALAAVNVVLLYFILPGLENDRFHGLDGTLFTLLL